MLKSDMLIESIDVPGIMKPWQIARKSIIACVSDFAAKGIRPYACLISIGIPRRYSKKYNFSCNWIYTSIKGV